MTASAQFCPLDRYLVDDLSERVLPFFGDSDLESSDISELLTNRVNSRLDKVGADLPDTYTTRNSVSGFEAYLFSLPRFVAETLSDGSDNSHLAEGLFNVFLGGGDPLRVAPAPHQIIFIACHDADTCRIKEIQPEECAIDQAIVSVRVSGIDAPEVGTYYVGRPGKEKPNPFSPKLVENTDKLRGEWLEGARLTKAETMLVNKFIAMHIDYTGGIAALIRNDLNTWNGSEGVPRTLEESQIQWIWEGEGEKTPPILCGTWQPFDIYGRRLGSFYQMYPSFLGIYLRQRLPVLMAQEGRRMLEEYKAQVRPLVQELERIRDPKVGQLLQMLGESFPDPETMFSVEKCGEIAVQYEAFIVAHGEHYMADDQILQIITGSVYGYEKYRNQDGDEYQAANDIARQNGFGFWSEPTFRTLYEINEGDLRYHPPHCPAMQSR